MNQAGNSDIITVKYDRNGNLIWKKYYDNQGKNDYASQIAIDNNGNILICGTTQINGLNYDYVVAKYTPDGNSSWISYYN